MTDVMIDIETWGVTPGSEIRSIGAVVFDPQRADPITDFQFYEATWLEPRDDRWIRDPDTMRWWAEQSDEAQQAFDNPLIIQTALRHLSDWFESLDAGGEMRVWAHGPHFDISILEAAYRIVGLEAPWKFWMIRDCRTAYDVAGVGDHREWVARFATEDHIPHHALHDAIVQARAVSAVL